MKCASLLLCLGTSATLQTSQSPAVTHDVDSATELGDGRAFVEMATERTTYFVDEPIRLRVRIGLEREFLRTNVVQMFRQQLDVPVQLVAPALANADCVLALADDAHAVKDAQASAAGTAPSREHAPPSFVLGDQVVVARSSAERVEGGRQFLVLEIERRLSPKCAGELVLPAALLRLAYATKFDEDFVHGRTAADRRDVFVRGAPLTLTIQSLPEAGRPNAFTGAVGRFTLQAQSDTRALHVDESLKLTLRIEGDGNLASFAAPRLDRLAGFYLQGQLDALDALGRTITYDLAPQSTSVREVPAIAFSYFDPDPPGSYRSLHTQPIALEVSPQAAAANVSNGEGASLEPGTRTSAGADAVSSAARRRARSVAWLCGAVLFVIALGALRWWRARVGRERRST